LEEFFEKLRDAKCHREGDKMVCEVELKGKKVICSVFEREGKIKVSCDADRVAV
jgi:hypothetical protein